LKILIKVLKKEEEAADILRDSLRDINGEIRKKQVSFEKIQKIKSMKAN
jgi:bacterioferritin (cytochrome b1)